jgi:Uma2 family endonuclease
MSTKVKATIEDLYCLPDNGKAEIVDGEIILMSPTGEMPGRAGGSICVSLRQHEGRTPGRAYPDNVGFHVDNSRGTKLS